MNGFLNILKPTGMTSSNVVGRVRYALNMKKVGHAGTLDPGAVGVLPIMLGRATRLFDYLNMDTKRYLAEYTFGKHTDTLDAEGEVLAQCNIVPTLEQIQAVIPSFCGTIEQIPPRVSAISINGVRAYDLARKGGDFEIQPRQVTIHQYHVMRQTDDRSFFFDIECSKGTYIRSLCRDMSTELNTYAYISYLSRIQSGYFHLDDALTLEELDQYCADGTINEYVHPLDAPLQHIPSTTIDNQQFQSVIHGVVVSHEHDSCPLTRVYYQDTFIGLGSIDDHLLKMKRVFYENNR